MEKVRETETGGVLVGHLMGVTLSVLAASGPGSRAELNAHSVLIDGVYAQQFCDAAFRLSHGNMDYVGDWHCHLAHFIKPSTMDLTAMKAMADFEGSPTKTPVTLIFSKYTDQFKTYLLTGKRTLRQIPCSIEQGGKREQKNLE